MNDLKNLICDGFVARVPLDTPGRTQWEMKSLTDFISHIYRFSFASKTYIARFIMIMLNQRYQYPRTSKA